jgi:hypothetical protein
VHLAGDVLTAGFRVAHGLDREQRRLAFTPSATFSTIAGRPISSGLSSLLMAVPMVKRGFEAGPVLSLRAKIVA